MAIISITTAFPEKPEGTAWRWVGFGLSAMVMLLMFYQLGQKRPKIGEAVTANVYRYMWRNARMLALPFIPGEVIFAIMDKRPGYGAAYVATLYFLAVDDLPSQPSKLRVWLESLLSPDPLPSEGSARTHNG